MRLSFRLSFLLLMCLISLGTSAQTSKYRCMLQMSNYMGEGAYIVVSLISPQGNYEKTLYVMGENKKWYNSLKEWYAFNSKKPANLSAITGTSITGGDRSVTTLELEDSKINKGYKLRFESAVEDQKYYAVDLEIELNDEHLATKNEGKNYIKYIRLNKI